MICSGAEISVGLKMGVKKWHIPNMHLEYAIEVGNVYPVTGKRMRKYKQQTTRKSAYFACVLDDRGSLGPFTGCSQPPDGPLVGCDVFLVFPLELCDEVVYHAVIEVLSSQVSVTRGRYHFKDTLFNGE